MILNGVFKTAVILLLGLVAPAIGQGLPDAFDGIARIESSGGRGSGFVVATDGNRFEVWTNHHVTGAAKKTVTVRLGVGTKQEKSFTGTVVWSAYDGTVDAAKIICLGRYDGFVFRIGNGSDGGAISCTGGHPRGGRAYAVRLTPDDRQSFGSVRAYRPASIEGQSGSPVIDENGVVIGVVTLRLGTGREAVGGMMPITDWTNPKGRPVSDSGIGKFQPIPNAKSDGNGNYG